MKTNIPAAWRTTLAAAVLLAVLALAYLVALHQLAPAPNGVAEQLMLPAINARPATLAGTAADTVAAPAPTPEPCPPHAVVVSEGSPAARRPWVVRRYVGTVGGQAATAVLQWQTPDSATGSFYLHRSGPEYNLTFNQARPGLVGKVDKGLAGEDEPDQGTWQLTTSLASPLLAGTWRQVGRVQPLLLRESYAGALRYTFKTQIIFGDYRAPENCAYVPETWHFLLMLPSLRAAPPVLRAHLAGSPAALHCRIWKDYDANDGDATGNYRDEVRLNDFQLFSYQTSSYVRAYGGTPDVGTASWLFDLRTGEELDIESQLKPGYERALRQRLTWHFLHDPGLAADREAGVGDWTDAEGGSSLLNLPDDNEALTLTGAGLEAAYTPAPFNRQVFILIPYRELRPLVRPGTPLARMLRARGLW
jgi:hypothetical protein